MYKFIKWFKEEKYNKFTKWDLVLCVGVRKPVSLGHPRACQWNKQQLILEIVETLTHRSSRRRQSFIMNLPSIVNQLLPTSILIAKSLRSVIEMFLSKSHNLNIPFPFIYLMISGRSFLIWPKSLLGNLWTPLSSVLGLLTLGHTAEGRSDEKESNCRFHFCHFNRLWLLIWTSNLKLLFVFSAQNIKIHIGSLSKLVFTGASCWISVPTVANLVKSTLSFLYNENKSLTLKT